MLAIMAPMFPTMEAKMSTPTKKSIVTNAYLSRMQSCNVSNAKKILLLSTNTNTTFSSQIYKIIQKNDEIECQVYINHINYSVVC